MAGQSVNINEPDDNDNELEEEQKFLSKFVQDLEAQQFFEGFIKNRKPEAKITELQVQPITKQTITIAVLGKTGAGKSSTCNTLIGMDKKFKTGLGQCSVTTEVRIESDTVQLDNSDQESEYILNVIDTPGFFDVEEDGNEQIRLLQEEISAMENDGILGAVESMRNTKMLLEKEQKQHRLEEIESDICKCLQSVTAPNISAFFVVISLIERIGPDTVEMFNSLLKLFGGKEFKKRAFLVFSHLDKISQTEDEYIEQYLLHPMVKNFLCEINNRYLLINNKLMKKDNKREDVMHWRLSCFQKVLDNLNQQNIQPYSILHCQIPLLSSQLSVLDEKMNSLIQKRTDVETEINNLWKTYAVHRKNVFIANTVSSGISIGLGLPLTIAGLALAVPTFGASTILTVAGAAISVGGGLTAGGASVVDIVKKGEATGKSTEQVKEFTEAVVEFQQTYDTVEENFLKVLQNLRSSMEAEVTCDATDVQSSNGSFIAATAFLQTLLSGGRVAFQVTASLSDDLLKLVGVVGVKAVPIVGVVVGTLLDIATLAQAVSTAQNTDKVYDEQFKSKIEECNKNFNELCQRVEQLKSTIQKFCDDPETFVRNLHVTLQTYYTCGICHEFCHDIQPCLIGKKHNAGCNQCLQSWHADQISRGKLATCPVCRQTWPTEV